MTDTPRKYFEQVEDAYAKQRQLVPNPLNIAVVMNNPTGWPKHHAFAKALHMLDDFDSAACRHGWEEDQGSLIAAQHAAREYEQAKSDLIAAITELARR